MKNSLRNSLAGLAIATSAIVAPGCDKEDKEIDTTQVATEAGVKKLLQEIPPFNPHASSGIRASDQEYNMRYGQVFNAIAEGTREPAPHFFRWVSMSTLREQGLQFEQKNSFGDKSLFVFVSLEGMSVLKVAYFDSASVPKTQAEMDFYNHMTAKYSGQVVTSALLDEIGAATAPHIMNNGDMGNFKKE